MRKALSNGLLFSPGAVCAALGVWQLQRRDWKIGQLDERRTRLAEPPLSLAALATQPSVEWRRVRGDGELTPGKAAYVRPPLLRVTWPRPHARPRQVGPRVHTIAGVAQSGYLLARCWRKETSFHR